MRFYTVLKLGPNREITPEGFTLFRNVTIARTGEQIYGPGEVDIPAGDDGVVHVMRTPEEVFRPRTLESIAGKPLVIDHPMDDVTPANWQHLAHGVLLDPRRGSGDQKDDTVGDLLVCTAQALAEIDGGKREISLGYDADYYQTGPGRGEQRNIIVNHVALVNEGRCGGRCAVRDKSHKGAFMAKTWKDRLRLALKSKDEKEIEKALDEAPETEAEGEGSEHHVHIHMGGERAADAEPEDPTEKRFKSIEDSIKSLTDAIGKKTGDSETEEEKKKREEEERKKAEDAAMEEELAEEAPEGTEDKARKSRDSAYLEESFESVKSIAEIIAPGVKIPTFDKAADPRKTFTDCICGLRRKALQLGTKDADTADLINQARGRTTDSAAIIDMSCGQVRTLFNSVGTLKKAQNNSAFFTDKTSAAAGKNGKTNDEQQTPMQRFKAASAARWGYKQ